MDMYVNVNGKNLRKGYTTGSCAAAASKAAVMMLVTGNTVHCIEIDTPAGVKLNLPVSDITLNPDSVTCAVIKDGGDDPDITTGLKIFAQVKLIDKPEILIKAGEGIGRVTLPGLKAEVGKPAINPVPMQMIKKEVKEVLTEGQGAEITLTVPGGEEVGARTYNPKLGILGGISILGTTGIVSPMSEDAWKESAALELSIMASKGYKEAYFIFGNYGEAFIHENFNINAEQIIKISNFVGFMLEKAVELSFENIILMGHAGKLVKVAAGIFNTHSRMADARMETLTAYAALEGAAQEKIQKIYHCKTTEAAMAIIDEIPLHSVYDRIVAGVSKRCAEYTFKKIQIGAVLFNAENKVLAIDELAKSKLITRCENE